MLKWHGEKVMEIILSILDILWKILLFLVIYILAAKVVRRYIHFPAPPYAAYFLDSGLRLWMQPPGKLIQRSGISEGMTVLEIGCGNGAYTPFIGRAVGNNGIEHALDIQQNMLDKLNSKLAKSKFKDVTNIRTVLGNAYELPFEGHSIDIVCMITVLQEIPDRAKALKEVKRVLKSNGKLAITELFVDPDYPRQTTTVKTVTGASFKLHQGQGDFWNYTVTFVPEGS